MRLRVAPSPELTALAAGVCSTALAALWVVRVSGETAVLTLAGPAVFAAMIAGFALRPHIAFAAMVPFFVFTAPLRLFVDQRIGAVKDIVVIAAAIAAAGVFVHRRGRRLRTAVDVPTLVLAAFLGLLYVLNVGGNVAGEDVYGQGWLHGMRLRLEPLLLFVAALVLRDPRRTLAAVSTSMVVTACIVSIYGVFQQMLGHERLADLGYVYGQELRTIGDQLRSFGTLDSPFTYAAFLALALGAAMFRRGRRSFRVAAVTIIMLGLAASLVRTTAVLAVALAALWLVQRGSRRGAAVLAATAVVAGLAVFASLDSRTTRTVQASPTLYLTLNGRTSVWEDALGGKPRAWLVGDGVGTSGTGAIRAAKSLFGEEQTEDDGGDEVVDSGYFVTILDVGLVGLALTLLLLAWIAVNAHRATRRGDEAGWIALATLIATLFTALTAEAFTNFPFAYLSMLILGLCAASFVQPPPDEKRDDRQASRRGA